MKIDFDAAQEAALDCFRSTVGFKLRTVSRWFKGGRSPQDDAALADFQAQIATDYGMLGLAYDQARLAMPLGLRKALAVESVRDKDIPLPKLGKKTFVTWHEVAAECVWQLLMIPTLVVDPTNDTFDAVKSVGGESGWGWLEEVTRDLPICPGSRPFWEKVVEQTRGNYPDDSIATYIGREWAHAVARKQGQGAGRDQLTPPLTRKCIAEIFNCHRNNVKTSVLEKYHHEFVGKKLRMRVADMSADYLDIIANHATKKAAE